MSRVGGAVLLVALLAAACGIPTDDEPRPLSAPTTDPATAPTTAPADSANSAPLYLSTGDPTAPLASVRRGLGGPPDPSLVMEALLAGPTGEDLRRGYSSFIPEGTRLVAAEPEGDLVTVELNEEFSPPSGNAGVAAFAQMVLTVTETPGYEVRRVRFRVAGGPLQAATPEGGAQDEVTAADYLALDPD